MPDDTILIEKEFPSKIVSQLAFREGNAKRFYRPILTIHKWFARRFGSVFRAILIFSSVSAINSRGISTISEKEFWEMYLHEYDFQDLVVCDPFMGGGTTIIEGVRLGHKLIGGDLNPVAWFTVKKALDQIDLDDLKEVFKQLESSVNSSITNFYKTYCPECQTTEASAMYYFWVKEIECEECGNQISLFRSYVFSNIKKTNENYILCPFCGDIFVSVLSEQVKCRSCSKIFDPLSFNLKRGHYYCDKCQYTNKVVKVEKQRLRLYAVEYYCPVCKERNYKKVDVSDIVLYKKVSDIYLEERDMLPIPDQKIPVGLKTQELINHNIFFFREMFNKRQLLVLGRLYREILDIENKNIREFFILIFSACLEYNNLLCEYHRNNHYIYNLFRKHAFPATPNPVENNVWGTKYGTGTFKNYFTKMLKVKKYCEEPYEIVIRNGKNTKHYMKNPIIAQVVHSFEELESKPENKKVLLYCNSSDNIPVPSNVVDLVVTDPPYFDNVMYAELSDFYYVWLRLGLKDDYEHFKPDYSPKEDEVVKNTKRGKNEDDYQNRLTNVFRECRRILKDDGLFIFTFHHKKLKAWKVLLHSLLDSGFYINKIYPVRSEMKTSTQIRGVRSLSFDVVFVCRKKETNNVSLDVEWNSLVEDSVGKQMEDFFEGTTVMSSLEDQLVLKIAAILKTITLNYPKIKKNGKDISISEMFDSLTSHFNKSF